MMAAYVSNQNYARENGSSYKIERVFIGTRTAEQVVADLIKVHTGASG